MTLADRVSLLLMIALALFALLAPWLQRRGKLGRLERWLARDPALLPPAGSWCGCCGRPVGEYSTWCNDCERHVSGRGQPHEQTWYATHDGEDCPYSGTWADDPMRGLTDLGHGIEETRLMPGFDQRDYGDETSAPEGLGIVRPPRCHRAYPSRTTPLELLPRAERELWREALKASL